MSKRFLILAFILPLNAVFLASSAGHSNEIHSSIQQLHSGDQSLQRIHSCASNADCDDGDPCTTEACANFNQELGSGVCMSTGRRADCPAPPAESQPAPSPPDCDDSRECTRDSFENGACVHFETTSCSLSNAPDCNDQDPCTTDLVLEDKSCSYVEIEGCRVSPPPEPPPPVDCDDGDPCTLDQRESETFCSHLPNANCGAPSIPPTENKTPEEAKEEPKNEEPVTAVTAPTANPDLMFGSGCALSMTSATLPFSWLWGVGLVCFWMKRLKGERD